MIIRSVTDAKTLTALVDDVVAAAKIEQPKKSRES
jgi:hypothetical protein